MGLTVRLALEDLRCDVAGGAALAGDAEPLCVGREAEVSQLDVRVVVLAGEQKVLGLEITVHDVLVVAEFDGLQHSEHQITCFFFRLKSLFNDTVKQFTTI